MWYCNDMDSAPPVTEGFTPESKGLDTWDDQSVLQSLHAGQLRAIDAVGSALPQIASAATLLAERLRAGGRLIYVGAGTSARIAVQDGSELPATFGMAEQRIVYLIAGGSAALIETLAEAEDDTAAGERDAQVCGRADTVIAVAASGSTPYTVAAAQSAKKLGSVIIAVTCNAGTALNQLADVSIVLISGPEVIAGSTRMGAGTAQKAALNLLSTLTHVYDGLMVNVQADNAKLRQRAQRIVCAITGVPIERAAEALAQAKGHVKPAALLCLGARSLAAAEELLSRHNGNLRLAMRHMAGP
jgi:N-acetylmuramic acid 6-phosphate etherase